MPLKYNNQDYDNKEHDLRALKNLRSVFRRMLMPNAGDRNPMVFETCYAWVTTKYAHQLILRTQFELTSSVQMELAEAARVAYRSRWEIKIPMVHDYAFMPDTIFREGTPHITEAQVHNSFELMSRNNPPSYDDNPTVQDFSIQEAYAVITNGNNVRFAHKSYNPGAELVTYDSYKINLVTWE